MGGLRQRDLDPVLAYPVRPYLVLGERASRAQAQVLQTLEAFERTLDCGHHALVLLGKGGEAELMLGEAESLIADYFEPADAAALPEELAGWVDGQRHRLDSQHEFTAASSVLVKDGTRGWLLVQFLPAQVPGRSDALLLSERSREPIPADRLAALGLTPREAEVLQHAAGGRTNEQIAQELFVSVRTVKKHLEHVYQKLGVRTRMGAVAKARGNGSGLL